MNIKVVADNKKARFDYELLELYEAGIELTGPEVKSIKSGHMSIKESYVVPKGHELYLLNAHVSPYGPAARENEDPKRSRRLLLKKDEIRNLINKSQAGGYTLVPVKIYLSHGLIKAEVALARGKKLHDKRETLKRKDQERDIQRELKNFGR